jgi:3-isopropylmalate/(R)-2-methylmalate dehydratase small subunit
MARVHRLGANIDTDQLAPGRCMSAPLAEPARQCLEDVAPGFAGPAVAGDIVVAGANSGIGSSREQAVQALQALGIAAIVAPSFGGIFFRNAINLGLPALRPVRAEDLSGLAEGQEAALDPDFGALRHAGGAILLEPLPDMLRAMLASGGPVPRLERRFAAGGR